MDIDLCDVNLIYFNRILYYECMHYTLMGHQSDLCTAIYYKTYCVCMVLIACHMHMLRIFDQFIKTLMHMHR